MGCTKAVSGGYRRTAALAVLIAAAVLASAAQAATDTRGYPRTFHRWGGWAGTETLAKYDMLVGFANYDLGYLRSRNSNAIYLLHPGLSPETPSDYDIQNVTYGALDQWRGGCDNLAGGVSLGCIRAFDPNWDYLRNANGSIAGRDNGTSGHSGWNLADPRGKGTAELVGKVFAYAAKKSGLYTKGWHGVHSDNWAFTIGESWLYGSNLDTDRDGRVDDYTVLRRNWSNGLVRVGHIIRTALPGKIVGGNGIWYKNPGADQGSEADGWLRSANYYMIEYWERFYDSPDQGIATVKRWLDYPDPYGQPRYVSTIHRAQQANGSLLCLSSGTNPNQNQYMLNAGVMKSMRWGLTLALMAGVYYEIYVGCPVMDSTRWWYDEYDGGEGIRRNNYLGQALGGPVKLANGVYRRDFQNGVALNNSTGSSQTVSLGGTFRKIKGAQNPTLNNGASVTSVTIPAKDGIILLRTGSSGTPPPSGTTTTSGFQVAHQGVANGQTVSGQVYWAATTSGATVSRVEFLIDGALRWTERSSPYEFNSGSTTRWDTTRETNGSHTLMVRAVATDGRTATATITVNVSNGGSSSSGFAVTSTGLRDGQTVSGRVTWGATVSGATVSRVEFLIDGTVRWTERSSPFSFKTDGTSGWDTTDYSDGQHTLTVRAVAADGRTATSTIRVTVNN
jgi:hypothetical protein